MVAAPSVLAASVSDTSGTWVWVGVCRWQRFLAKRAGVLAERKFDFFCHPLVHALGLLFPLLRCSL